MFDDAGSPMPLGNISPSDVRDGCIGEGHVFYTPFGPRRMIYADSGASGQALSPVEKVVLEDVKPMYGNTHTEASGTSEQTTKFREDGRDSLKKEFEVPEEGSVIFTGSGATAAINKVATSLNIRRLRERRDNKGGSTAQNPEDDGPVVFIGPYEHHSNILPWRETLGAKVVRIDLDKNGHIDLEHLETELKLYKGRELIGSFSAASNVTGVLTDTEAITTMLHKHQALALFDYAAAGGHIKITMGEKDAMFLSPHKLPGGVEASGILVARNHLFDKTTPAVAGGGTVEFVNDKIHHYTNDITHREEGGTPDIVGDIRAALAFRVKTQVGYDVIRKREDAFLRRALAAWGREGSNINVLGNPKSKRLAIVSFTVRHNPRNQRYQLRHNQKSLHHNFVVALLNDLYGIQARGGCSCAGPYGHILLGVDEKESLRFCEACKEGNLGIKPGWVRVTFDYHMSDAVCDYIINAVQAIAQHGWALLPLYTFNPEAGLWTHREGPAKPAMSFDELALKCRALFSKTGDLKSSEVETMPESILLEHEKEAEAVFERNIKNAEARRTLFSERDSRVSDRFDALRWFPLPSVCLDGVCLPATSEGATATKRKRSVSSNDPATESSNIMRVGSNIANPKRRPNPPTIKLRSSPRLFSGTPSPRTASSQTFSDGASTLVATPGEKPSSSPLDGYFQPWAGGQLVLVDKQNQPLGAGALAEPPRRRRRL